MAWEEYELSKARSSTFSIAQKDGYSKVSCVVLIISDNIPALVDRKRGGQLKVKTKQWHT